MACNLYRATPYDFLEGGYVVYRHCFDESKCTLREGAMAHKQAVFVDELSAQHYCRYRNRLTDRSGSDAIR